MLLDGLAARGVRDLRDRGERLARQRRVDRLVEDRERVFAARVEHAADRGRLVVDLVLARILGSALLDVLDRNCRDEGSRILASGHRGDLEQVRGQLATLCLARRDLGLVVLVVVERRVDREREQTREQRGEQREPRISEEPHERASSATTATATGAGSATGLSWPARIIRTAGRAPIRRLAISPRPARPTSRWWPTT